MNNEELIRQYNITNDATYLDKLYKNNHKLITSIATKRMAHDDILFSFDDYMSECNIAFVKCIKTYSDESSAKFSSVAYQYMNNACRQLIRRNNMKKRNSGYEMISMSATCKQDEGITFYDTTTYDDIVFNEYQDDENELYNVLKNKVYRKHVEILDLLNEGYTQKEISEKLNCSHQKISASVKAMRLVAIDNGFRL